MTISLYRKYRPQTFAELIGQNHIKVTLQNELEMSRTAHAYLFSGPRGSGKTTTARLLAKAVNCLNRKSDQSEPCDKCDSCLEIKEGRSLDVVEIDAASHTGVDNVRENIINSARFTPTSRKFKVFIIDEVHMLSISAFNALLKTLEEPPAHAIFILATTEIHKVPQTIISRCQRFDFRKVSTPELIKRLEHIAQEEKKEVDPSILESITSYAEGSVRDAETLFGQILSLGDKKITKEQAELVIPSSHVDLVLELIIYIFKKDSAKAIELINRLVQDGVDLNRFTADLIEILRKMILVRISNQLNEFTRIFNQKLEQEFLNASQAVKLDELTGIINIFIEAKKELKSAEIYQLPLEIAIIKICHATNYQLPDDDLNDGDNDDEEPGQPKSKPTPSTTQNKAKESGGLLKSEKSAIIDNNIGIKSETLAQKAEKEAENPKNEISKIKLTIEQVREKWEEVLICIKDYNHSLASTLRQHQPSAVKEDGVIEICFKYQFHQQRVNDLKNKQALEKVLSQVFKTPVRVKTLIVKELPDNKMEMQGLTEGNPKQQVVDDILKSFGGQLVD